MLRKVIGAIIVVSAVGFGTVVSRGQFGPIPRCLHGEDETAENRDRRDQAVALARAINSAQGQAAARTRRYLLLSEIGNLPPTPPGFIVRLYADQDGYLFSVKDDRDSCRFGIFSDERGTIYQMTPVLPLVAS